MKSNLVCAFLLGTFVLSSCGTGVRGGPGVTLNLLSSESPSSASLVSAQSFLPGTLPLYPMNSSANTGEASAEDLKSLKYSILSIKICEDLTINGTGYSNEKNCLQLYNRGVDEGSYSSFNIAKALQSDEGYIDLMDYAAAKAKLNQTVTAKVGTYNFGVINWMKPIKVRAEVPLTNGERLVTKKSHNASGSVSTIPDMRGAEGDSEEVVFEHNNGGTWFRFQSPFRITQADINKNTSYQLDLVFNPDRLIKGADSPGGGSVLSDSAGRSLTVPFLDLSPVVRKANETTIKETYIISGAAFPHADYRIELYSIKEDPSKTIYGVDQKVLFKGSQTTVKLFHPYQAFFTELQNGRLSFLDYQREPYFKGLTRLTSLNSTSPVTMLCRGEHAMYNLCTKGAELAMTATLVGITEVK